MNLRKKLLSKRGGLASVSQVLFSNATVQVANFCCGVLTARSLGPAGRGQLAALIMWPQFFAYALTLGIPVASIYRVKKEPEKSRAIIGTALAASLVLGFVAMGVGVLILPWSLRAYTPATIRLAQ